MHFAELGYGFGRVVAARDKAESDRTVYRYSGSIADKHQRGIGYGNVVADHRFGERKEFSFRLSFNYGVLHAVDPFVYQLEAVVYGAEKLIQAHIVVYDDYSVEFFPCFQLITLAVPYADHINVLWLLLFYRFGKCADIECICLETASCARNRIIGCGDIRG